MGAPYGMEIVESCLSCKLRTQGRFCDLSPAALHSFEAITYTTVYPEGSVLFVEGQMPRGVFLLCQGRAKLSVAANERKRLILKIAGPGEMLGLAATISGKPYELSAMTMDPCQVTFVKAPEFLRFVHEHAEACFGVAQQLSEKFKSACHFRSRTLSRSPAERLAKLLLEWSANADSSVKGETRFSLTLTHDEIAEMIETTRETVTRWFNRLKKRGIVKMHGATLTICNEPLLRRMAGT
jgi:CRP/FNR family transcriptional regulator